MSEDTAESRYVNYCEEWFGVTVDPNAQYVQVEQWKMYRLYDQHKYYRISYYFYAVFTIIFAILFLWAGLT